jgi:hypothetical protein
MQDKNQDSVTSLPLVVCIGVLETLNFTAQGADEWQSLP